MRRALALIAACAGAVFADPLPAAPVVTPPRAAPAPPVIVEGAAGLATDFRGTQSGSLGARLLRRAWSAELALEGTTPEAHAMVDVVRGGVTLAGCRHFALVALCPVVHAGAMHASGTGVTIATEPLLELGARFALELQATRRIAVRVRYEGRLLVTSSTFTSEGGRAWSTPHGEMWLGVDALVRIR